MADDATVIVADDTDTTTADTTATTTAADTIDTTADTTTADTTATTTTTKTADTKGDDWRTAMAGEDPALLKFLGRYHSQPAALKALKGIHDDVRSGKYLKPLDENATDEEKAAFRKQMGVPDTVEAYLENLPNGLVVGEDDKPFVNTFLEKMHAAGAPKGVADAALSAYYEIVENQASEASDKAAQARTTGEDELREEWGADYRRNLNIMHNYLGTLPEPVQNVFMQGRGPDGIPIGYNPEVLKWLTGKAMEENPVATVVPGAGANQATAVADEIASLEKLMGDTTSDYWRGPKAAANQERYRVLVEAREKLK